MITTRQQLRKLIKNAILIESEYIPTGVAMPKGTGVVMQAPEVSRREQAVSYKPISLADVTNPKEFKEALSGYIANILGYKPGDTINKATDHYETLSAMVRAAYDRDKRFLRSRLKHTSGEDFSRALARIQSVRSLHSQEIPLERSRSGFVFKP